MSEPVARHRSGSCVELGAEVQTPARRPGWSNYGCGSGGKTATGPRKSKVTLLEQWADIIWKTAHAEVTIKGSD